MVSDREQSDSSSTLEEEYGLREKCREFLLARNNTSFDALIKFAEDIGFVGTRDGTSHWVGRHPTYDNGPPAFNKVNFQSVDGKKAKPYQVKQLVDFIQNATPRKGK